MVPYPFTRALYLYGDPITIPRRLTPDQTELWRRRIEEILNELDERAERDFDALFAAGKRSR